VRPELFALIGPASETPKQPLLLDERDAMRVEDLRIATSGMAVAGTYMPGLRALIDGMAVASRARAADWFTSFFLLGSSLSFLLRQAGLMRTGALVNGALGVIACCLPGWCYLTFSPRTASRNTELSPGLGPRQLGPAVASPAASPQPTRQTARGDQEPKSSVLSGH